MTTRKIQSKMSNKMNAKISQRKLSFLEFNHVWRTTLTWFCVQSKDKFTKSANNKFLLANTSICDFNI